MNALALMQTFTSIQQWADYYIQRSQRVVPLAPGQKAPEHKNWLRLVHKASDFRPEDNIGIVLVNGLVDNDNDSKEAVALAPIFMPDTGAIFGRARKSGSHRLYHCPDLDKPLAFKDYGAAKDDAMISELRVNSQSMAPPSRHPEGEVVRWERFEEIAQQNAEDLVRAFKLLCTAALVARYYNPPGQRHDWGLALAGVLLRCALKENEAIKVVDEAGKYVGDPDTKDRVAAVRSTYAHDKEDALKSFKVLKEEMPDRRGALFLKSLGKIWNTAEAVNGIVMQGGKLSEIVDRAEAALLAAGTPIYQRAGALVHPVRLNTQTVDESDVRRAAGAMVLHPVKPTWLVEQMGLAAPWYRLGADGTPHRADPQPTYALTLLSRVGKWGFSPLRGIVTTPTIDTNGRVIETPGYDEASGLLLDFTPGTFPSVPQRPTKDDAAKALEQLTHPLRGFPFADEPSKAVALAAMLTSLIRVLMRTAPLHAFDAPTAGTGKSMLAEGVGILPLGVKPPSLSQGKTPEEDEKRLSTVLATGDPVLLIDNCERPLTGDFLCSMLTQEVVQARILGLSERRVMPSTALVLASGNNLTFVGDMSRRAVRCRLDAKVERPDAREFSFDARDEILASRPQLVVAALTILRAYDVAGRPERVRPMGSFADYAFVRGALLWLGCADPKDTLDEILDDDPKKDELRTVMELWEAAIGDRAIEVGDIDKGATENAVPNFGALRDALVEHACRGVWNAKSVGWWLRRQKDRVSDGRAFRCEKGDDRLRWRLAGATPQAELPYGASDVPREPEGWREYGPE